MAKYRKNLPMLSDKVFITDGGLETTLLFNDGLELPQFAAFVVLENAKGRNALTKYFRKYASIASQHGLGFVLESPTWRASSKWGNLLGYSENSLAQVNRDAINLLAQIRGEYENNNTTIVISGCMGPKGDGYLIEEKMDVDQAKNYHLPQIETFSETEADLVSAFTLTYSEEAIGIVHAAQSVGMPVVVGFTVETDGNLPSGQTVKDAINTVDRATDSYAAVTPEWS